MKKLKEIMIILIILIGIICTENKIVEASYVDGNPSDSSQGGDPYAPGQQIQEEEKEEAEKEEEKKEEEEKEEAEEKKELSDEEKKNFTADEIIDYIKHNYKDDSGGITDGSITKIEESQEVIDKWKTTLNNAGYNDGGTAEQQQITNAVEAQASSDSEGNPIYKNPSKIGQDGDSEKNLEDMINDADEFISKGTSEISQEALSNFSKTLYNILLSIGIVVAVIVGALIGIKLMTSSIEENAEAKKLLVPYVVGCVVVFGGFTIWKLVVTVLQNI